MAKLSLFNWEPSIVVGFITVCKLYIYKNKNEGNVIFYSGYIYLNPQIMPLCYNLKPLEQGKILGTDQPLY